MKFKPLSSAAFASVFLVLSGGSSAQEGMSMDARNFLAVCSTPDHNWISFCNGYVQAVFDTAWRVEATKDICPPAGTTRTHLVEQATAYLSVLPNLDTVNASQVIHAILREVYPC